MYLIQSCSILRTNYDNNNRRRRGRKKRKKTNKKKEKQKEKGKKKNGMEKEKGMGRKSPIYGHQIMSKFISYSEIAEEITVKKEPSRIYLFIRFFFFPFSGFKDLYC